MRKKILSLFVVFSLLFAMSVTLFGCSEEVEEFIDDVKEELEEEEKGTTTTTDSPTTTTTVAATSESTTEPTTIQTTIETTVEATEAEITIDRDGSYTTRDDVALYIYTYGELPSNFMTKNEARALGWEGGSLEPYAPGMCIGGDYFGNYEGLLPEQSGREYHECDIDTLGASSRGAKRIIFSNDGLIYYTADHYNSFTLLYGEE